MRRATGAALVAAVLLVACDDGPADRTVDRAEPVATASASATPFRSPAGEHPAAVGANELGRVPVLMHHQITADARQPSDRTPAEFRAELRRLYDQGYRPVTAADYLAGNVDLPAGTHPVVLTFDDATAGQARIGPDGEPEPDTALGILEAFGRTHPDFRPTATFFVITARTPFGDAAVLPWLAANGYEIGAHTRSHPDLSTLDDARVQAEIGRNLADIAAAVPGYRVRTFATPYGKPPRTAALAREGVYDGVPYRFDGVFGVGGLNATSPFAAAFDPLAVPRLAYGLSSAETALAALRSRPATRYTSDGDPSLITFPADADARLAPAWRSRARSY